MSPPPLKNLDLKKSALLVIAESATITDWEETPLGGGVIRLKLVCLIDRKKVMKVT